ncbi:hypothetical protein K1J08_01085 [Streptococcus sanguinis]|uniref:hypothetical protein n=1 Tax=Streptococcus sanguinis TaxID=1305 RepID=UPI001CBCD8FC|nr:hypothetical protein [Streptococcus sanguinis]MBZ2037327.1 hypothetical protein [Streptococcus sanguinis]MBZ2068011.1 hypothetical protein [Streptococcus sanguinis]MBZ2069874.1 hypothetical protein [Streptococcus sanguinis]
MRSRNYFAILAQEAAQPKLEQPLFLTAIFCVRFHREKFDFFKTFSDKKRIMRDETSIEILKGDSCKHGKLFSQQ